jgi:hypothetical protein
MKYRHYKGGIYEIVCEAKLEADPDVVMMVYQSAADGMIWTRPKVAFLELVEWDGCMVPRFAPIG